MSADSPPAPAPAQSNDRQAGAADPGTGMQAPSCATGELTRSACIPASANQQPPLRTNSTRARTSPVGRACSGPACLAFPARRPVAIRTSRPPGPVPGCRTDPGRTRLPDNRPIPGRRRRGLVACTTPIDQRSILRRASEFAGALAGPGARVAANVGDASPSGLTGRGGRPSNRRAGLKRRGCQRASTRPSPVSRAGWIPVPGSPFQQERQWVGPARRAPAVCTPRPKPPGHRIHTERLPRRPQPAPGRRTSIP